MKLQAEVDDKRHEIEIKRDGRNLFASIDGREYELEISEPESNVYLFKNRGKVVEAFVTTNGKAGEPYQVQIGSNSFDIKLIDPKRLRGSGSNSDQGQGTAEIKTAMPGKVVRILLQAGSEVVKGEGVLVVEAMKMQNELKSPKAGNVKEIKVEEGATVAAGDVLAVIE